MAIGERIRARRNELGWSINELADRMGYANHSSIARIETGKSDMPQSKIAKFAEVLGTSVSYLMGWDEIDKKNNALSDILIRMRKDEEFLSIVEKLHEDEAFYTLVRTLKAGLDQSDRLS